MKQHYRRAFTLVELLVVIAIIGILAGFSVPRFSKLKYSAQTRQCASNLRQLGAIAFQYAADHNGQVENPFGAYRELTDHESEFYRQNYFAKYLAIAGYTNHDAKGSLFMCPAEHRTRAWDVDGSGGATEIRLNCSYSMAEDNDFPQAENPSYRGFMLDGCAGQFIVRTASGSAQGDFWGGNGYNFSRYQASFRHGLKIEADQVERVMNPRSVAWDWPGRANILFFDGHVRDFVAAEVMYDTGNQWTNRLIGWSQSHESSIKNQD